MTVKIDDRRVFDRFTARFPVKFQYSRNDFGSNVFLRDISAEGAKIVTKEQINLEDKVDLVVELPDGHDPLILSGKIVWSRAINPSAFDAGLRFDKVDFMDTQRIFKYCQ
ncbi:MAG: PilZ domain-containing protein [Candidatus Omnitrophota bacterium]